MNYHDQIWHFTADPLARTVRVAVYPRESDLFVAPHAPGRTDTSYPFVGLIRGSGAPAIDTRSTAQPRGDVATELWRALPVELRRAFAQGTAQRPVRIKIVSELRQVMDLPWESLESDAGPVGLDDRVRLVRCAPVRFALAALPMSGPLRIVLALSNPEAKQMADVGREQEVLIHAIARADVEVSLLLNPTLPRLQAALRARPNVLHFVGHAGTGSDDGGSLILPGEAGGTHWLDAPAVARVLPSSVRLVCASSCFTAPNYDIRGLLRFALAPAELDLPTTVTQQAQPRDDGTTTAAFWREFYRCLAATGDVVDATHHGRRAAAAAGASGDAGDFVAVIRDSHGQPFTMAAEGPAIDLDVELERHLSRRLANGLANSLTSLSGPANCEDVAPQADHQGPKGWRISSTQSQPALAPVGALTSSMIDSLTSKDPDDGT